MTEVYKRRVIRVTGVLLKMCVFAWLIKSKFNFPSIFFEFEIVTSKDTIETSIYKMITLSMWKLPVLKHCWKWLFLPVLSVWIVKNFTPPPSHRQSAFFNFVPIPIKNTGFSNRFEIFKYLIIPKSDTS